MHVRVCVRVCVFVCMGVCAQLISALSEAQFFYPCKKGIIVRHRYIGTQVGNCRDQTKTPFSSDKLLY